METVLATFVGQIQAFLDLEDLGEVYAVAGIVHRALKPFFRRLFHTHIANEVAGSSLFPRPPFYFD